MHQQLHCKPNVSISFKWTEFSVNVEQACGNDDILCFYGDLLYGLCQVQYTVA